MALSRAAPISGSWAQWVVMLALSVMLMACGGEPERVWASQEEVDAALYTHPGPPELVLITVISNDSGRGGHTALLVNGGHRVLFDPAGSWQNQPVPERHDVHFGMRPGVLEGYLNYHIRNSHHVVLQRVRVSPQVAAQALNLVQQSGPVRRGYCARVTGEVLRELPGFGWVGDYWWPDELMEDFARIPGIETYVLRENDPNLRAHISGGVHAPDKHRAAL